MSRNAPINSSSSTRRTSSTFSLTKGRILSPTAFTAVPSAIVLALSSCTTSPAASAAFILAASAGSTPITFIFGFNILASVATPETSPPPPIGTKIYSTSGSSLKISIAIVPWPVATSMSLNGCTNVYPSFSASSHA